MLSLAGTVKDPLAAAAYLTEMLVVKTAMEV